MCFVDSSNTLTCVAGDYSNETTTSDGGDSPYTGPLTPDPPSAENSTTTPDPAVTDPDPVSAENSTILPEPPVTDPDPVPAENSTTTPDLPVIDPEPPVTDPDPISAENSTTLPEPPVTDPDPVPAENSTTPPEPPVTDLDPISAENSTTPPDPPVTDPDFMPAENSTTTPDPAVIDPDPVSAENSTILPEPPVTDPDPVPAENSTTTPDPPIIDPDFVPAENSTTTPESPLTNPDPISAENSTTPSELPPTDPGLVSAESSTTPSDRPATDPGLNSAENSSTPSDPPISCASSPPSADSNSSESSTACTNSSSTALKPATIGGIAAGATALVLLLAIILFFYCRKRQRKPVLPEEFPPKQNQEVEVKPVLLVEEKPGQRVTVPPHLKVEDLYSNLALDPFSDTIRVLILPPGSISDPIVCRLAKVSLKDSTFCALSYTWGDKSFTSPISVNEVTFQITKNLESALRHLRRFSEGEGLMLWVDAICIKQDDEKEKGQQLRRMRDIYGRAKRTYVWLGDETSDSNAAIDFFNRGGRARASKRRLLDEYTSNQSSWNRFMTDVVARAWFTRLWIVQEIVMSDDPLVVCGTRDIPWTVIARMLRIVVDHNLDVTIASDFTRQFSGSTCMLAAFREERQAGTEPDLMFWLSVFANQRCEREKDRIFGLLGLAADRNDPDLELKYEESAVQTFTKATEHIIVKNHTLDFICCGRGPGRMHGLPTWVPDFTLPPANSFQSLTESSYDPNEGFSAGGIQCPIPDGEVPAHLYSSSMSPHRFSPSGAPILFQPWFEADSTVLLAPGILVDEIREVGTIILDKEMLSYPPGQALEPGHPLRAHLELVGDEIGRLACGGDGHPLLTELYPTRRETYIGALSRTLMLDRDQRNRRLAPGEGYFQSPLPHPSAARQNFDLPLELRQRACDFQRFDTWRKLAGRRFMKSRQGSIGLVPPDAQARDAICVLYGCSVPVILRRNAQGWYTFIGER